MTRAATILIAIAMVVTAASLSSILYLRFGLSIPESAAFGLAFLFGMALLQLHLGRRRDRRWMEARLADLSTVTGDVTGDMSALAARFANIESLIIERIRAENGPLLNEVEVLGHLMKQIAETLADTETRFQKRIERLENAPRYEPPQPDLAAAASLFVNEPAPVRAPAAPQRTVIEPSRMPTPQEREVETAIRAERIEIHLQPIVTLPQRKVRYYEVLSRLRAGDGRMITAAEAIPAAESRRVIAKLDTYQVIRSFQILKRLMTRNGEVGMFVNLSMQSIADSAFFREFIGFLGQNRSLADLVQFEFTQSSLREMGPLEFESLRAITDVGFRFSVDNVTDLRSDFHQLYDIGFRTAKISADRLLGRTSMTAGDIHPADLAGHLKRQGLNLVVDHIETESQVIDLLDFDVELAQGFLFSTPRQVRPEILGTAAPTPEARASVRPSAAR